MSIRLLRDKPRKLWTEKETKAYWAEINRNKKLLAAARRKYWQERPTSNKRP